MPHDNRNIPSVDRASSCTLGKRSSSAISQKGLSAKITQKNRTLHTEKRNGSNNFTMKGQCGRDAFHEKQFTEERRTDRKSRTKFTSKCSNDTDYDDRLVALRREIQDWKINEVLTSRTEERLTETPSEHRTFSYASDETTKRQRSPNNPLKSVRTYIDFPAVTNNHDALEYLDLRNEPVIPSSIPCQSKMHSQSSCDCYCKTREPTQPRKNEAQSDRSRVKLITSKTSGSKTDAIRSARKVPTTPATPVNDDQPDTKRSTAILPVSPVLSPETSAALEDLERLVKDAQIQIKAIKMVGDCSGLQTPVNAYSNEISLDDENDQLLYVRERVANKFQEANGVNDERRVPEKPKRIVDFSAPKFKRFEERYKEFPWCGLFGIQNLGISTVDTENKGRADDPHEIPNNERNAKMNSFSVQTCPSVNIERHLTAQNLESIHISPDPSFVRENVNVGTYIVSHDRGTKTQVRKEKFVKIFEEPKDAASNKRSSETQSEKNGKATNEIESSPEDSSHSSLSRRRSAGILVASGEGRHDVGDVHEKSQNREIQVEIKTSQQRTDDGTTEEAASSSNSEQKQVRFNEVVAENIDGPILKLRRKGSTSVESGGESILKRGIEMRQDLLNREYKHSKLVDQRFASLHRKYCNQSELNQVVKENIDEGPILKLDRKRSTSVESGDDSILKREIEMRQDLLSPREKRKKEVQDEENREYMHGKNVDQRFASLHRKYCDQNELKQACLDEVVEENIEKGSVLKLDAGGSVSVEPDDESILKREIEIGQVLLSPRDKRRKEVRDREYKHGKIIDQRMASVHRKNSNQSQQKQARSNEVVAENIEKGPVLNLDTKGSTSIESDDESILKKEIEIRQVLLSPRTTRKKEVHDEENREYKHGKVVDQLFSSLHRKYCNQSEPRQARLNEVVEENIEKGSVLKRDARGSAFVESDDESILRRETEIRTVLLSPRDKREVRDEENRGYKHGQMIDQRFASVHPKYCNRNEQTVENSSLLESSRMDTSGEGFGHENDDDDELYYPSIDELDDVLLAYDKTIADAARSVRAIDRYLSRPELAEFLRKDETSESDEPRNSTRPTREKFETPKRNSCNYMRSKDSIRDRAVVKNKRMNEARQSRAKSDSRNKSVLPRNSYKTPLRVDSRILSNGGAKLTESDSKKILRHVEETYANFFTVSRPRESVVFQTRDESSSMTSSVNLSFSSMDAQNVDEHRIETISKVADNNVAEVPSPRSNMAFVRDVERKQTETKVGFEETLKHTFNVDEMIPILVKNLLQHFQNGAIGSPQNIELLITENVSANNVESNIHEIDTARLKTDNESEKECLGTGFEADATEIIKIDEKITEKYANGKSTRENINSDLIDKPISRSSNSEQTASSCLNQELSCAEPRKIRSNIESFGELLRTRNGENNDVKSCEYLEQKGSNNGSLASSRDVSNIVDKKTAKTSENISNSSTNNSSAKSEGIGSTRSRGSSNDHSSSKPNPIVENEKIESRLDQAKSYDNVRRASSSDSLRDCVSLRSSSRSETKVLNTKESTGQIKDTDQFTEMNHEKRRMFQKEKILSHLYEEMREQLLHSAHATNYSSLVQQDVRTSKDAPATVSTKIETVSSDTSRSEGELFVPSSGSCSLGEIKMLNTDEQDNIITVFVTKETLTLWSESSKSLVQSMGEI
ncbi:uncharacterized protein LOC143209473 isoform X2 [Lasioglossum baleicum]|uniref:uncharacterized protein LOC143209473 isoform X2 n=1 Tax=Lasioglossum baleicum TaxID=434251 RepID=UPI003FCE2F80